MNHYKDCEALALLEELLALSEHLRDDLPDTGFETGETGWDAWGRISARAADLRDGEEV